MTTQRSETSTRQRLIEATATIMRDEGYAAATSRRVAAEAGVKQALVYYYFPTMDDLFVEVLRAGAEASLERMREALTDADPLRALWRINSDLRATSLNTEFMALANHRKAIRSHMAEHCEEMRRREVDIFTRLLGERLAGPDGCPPEGLSLVLAGIGRALVMEGGLGVTAGHEEARAFVEQWLDRLAPPPDKKEE